ncbi:hypothetical protein PGT21_012415 [Puccinia graminis f. sp. tritici]|uniref:Calcineurin-like phosphoesterase domain-containing protein n=2 Tax=Puccinia graminis f. sp. tritici TaxID=56615 RepID=A0A5B0LSW1_PUCGR|nr:hypothetical protein PGTUg99_024455 [Puccinia graminis f. sp. tritici]KAA1071592.1 hypothetical protein PGT21_012415 [Puccinia graminis f. sp. tritici]
MLGLLYRQRRLLITVISLVIIFKYIYRDTSGSSKAKPKPKKNHHTQHQSSPSNLKKFSSRIVAVGDLHGDLDHAVRVLRMAGVVDLRNQWIGGPSILVQTGDIVDRGKDTILLYKWMDALRTEAQAAGGAVVSLLGNHEYMNALGDWRYVTKEDIETFGSAESRRKVMSTQGWIGKTWEANYSVTARIPYALGFQELPRRSSQTSTTRRFTESFSEEEEEEESDPFLDAGTVFVHGGITPEYATLGISEINRIGHSLLHRALAGTIPYNHLPPHTPPEEAKLYAEHGPLWERSYALEDDERRICRQIEIATQRLHVRRMVMGHTPQFKGISSRCGGKILLIDTGISSAYGGPLTALEINYSLTPLSHNSSFSSWNERESVFAIQELADKKKLAGFHRIVNLTESLHH